MRTIIDKAEDTLGVKHIGHSPRGRPPELHFTPNEKSNRYFYERVENKASAHE